MGGMTRKQVIALVVGVVVVIGIVVAMIVVGSQEKKAEAVPTGTPTIATQAPAPETAVPNLPVVESPAAQTPSPEATSVNGLPSPVSPDFEILDLGDPPALDEMAGADEKAIREKVYAAVPIFMNSAGPQYKDPNGARDELLAKGLITENMAKTQFFPDWIPYQKDINSAQFTVQTQSMFCTLRGQAPETVFDRGSMTCYYTRQHVDADGSRVPIQKYKQSITGGIGAIDPSEQARIRVKIVEENGVWKIDAINNG
jgi:hypothetical protein